MSVVMVDWVVVYILSVGYVNRGILSHMNGEGAHWSYYQAG
jgi:hypothetical protein